MANGKGSFENAVENTIKMIEFSNTSTVPLAPPGVDVTDGAFIITNAAHFKDGLIVFRVRRGGRTFPVIQRSLENQRLLSRVELPVRARLAWDGWRYTLRIPSD